MRILKSSHLWGVPANTTMWKFHKLIPVMSLSSAAVPKLLKIMENRLSLVIFACILAILIVHVILSASLIDTSQFSLFGPKLLFLLSL